ncbi:Bud site selection protein bud4, partial [Friedmanniomyces endolithicus]
MPMSPRAARGTRSAGSSPRKPSAEQVLKTEPWNGKTRRKSMRQASAQQQARGPAPPLPGQESAMALSSVDEDYATATGNLDDEVPEGTERGRLFVKVVGVKDLDLPLPRNDRVYFQLTLDNGLHCVTTADLELGKTAPIGQEFELVVQEDLEFQLTLTTKLPP